jgi:hypothetical protein
MVAHRTRFRKAAADRLEAARQRAAQEQHPSRIEPGGVFSVHRETLR